MSDVISLDADLASFLSSSKKTDSSYTVSANCSKTRVLEGLLARAF